MGKIKRFLLRYEPPGIGLEVEDEGQVEVRHKDFPAASEVRTKQDIDLLVDNLIAEEPGLLTKRRHRAALLQLLGRLFQVEVEDTEAEDNGGASDAAGGDASARKANKPPKVESEPPAAAAPADDGLKEGQQIVLIGLKGKVQQHNGELGQLVKVRADKNKYEVLLASTKGQDAETLKIKGAEHIVPCAPKGLAVGTHVAIRGLRNHVELNGCLGRVVECHEENHRFEVRATESGQLFRVKQENLVPIEMCPQVASAAVNRDAANTNSTPRLNKNASGGGASSSAPPPIGQAASAASLGGDGNGDGVDDALQPGSVVQLTGLKTAMCYNGQTAEVLSVDRARSRYEIRLGDGSVKTIRAENVVSMTQGAGAAKQSPRRKKEGKHG